jgi:hypothetical protein
MTKNAALKKAVRAYQDAHPGLTWPQARRKVIEAHKAQPETPKPTETF